MTTAQCACPRAAIMPTGNARAHYSDIEVSSGELGNGLCNKINVLLVCNNFISNLSRIAISVHDCTGTDYRERFMLDDHSHNYTRSLLSAIINFKIITYQL